MMPAEPAPPLELWLPDGHPLRSAQDAWGLPLPCDLSVEYVPGDDASVACGVDPKEPGRVGGCAVIRECKVILTDHTTMFVKVHELGHILRGGAGHPTDGCPSDKAGPHIMCSHGSTRANEPTPDSVDYAWVLGEAPYERK